MPPSTPDGLIPLADGHVDLVRHVFVRAGHARGRAARLPRAPPHEDVGRDELLTRVRHYKAQAAELVKARHVYETVLDDKPLPDGFRVRFEPYEAVAGTLVHVVVARTGPSGKTMLAECTASVDHREVASLARESLRVE